jgi:hypothetical protein
VAGTAGAVDAPERLAAMRAAAAGLLSRAPRTPSPAHCCNAPEGASHERTYHLDGEPVPAGGPVDGVFGLIGFRRGVNRELISLLGLGVRCWWPRNWPRRWTTSQSLLSHGALRPWRRPGSEDPAAAWEAAKAPRAALSN